MRMKNVVEGEKEVKAFTFSPCLSADTTPLHHVIGEEHVKFAEKLAQNWAEFRTISFAQ